MNLEQQVTNLELSKKLKELGVPQFSIFDWVEIDDDEYLLMGRIQKEFEKMDDEAKAGCISAFTASELGEILRPHLKKSIWLEDINEAMEKATYMEDEANSRAQMVIYLIENSLITL